jgi:hypothetical protein
MDGFTGILTGIWLSVTNWTVLAVAVSGLLLVHLGAFV